jgi:plastocyanin
MKKLYVLIIILLFTFGSAPTFATTWTIVNSGFTFSPNVLTITLGDTVIFTLAGSHNAVEVSQATWLANGNTSNGGFVVPFGGGQIIPNQVKTYYYVCQPHASSGMKGQIIVNNSTGIPDPVAEDGILRLTPNPVSSSVIIKTGLATGTPNQMKIYDLTGKSLLARQNVNTGDVLDVSTFRRGVYFIELVSDGRKRVSKLVVGQ